MSGLMSSPTIQTMVGRLAGGASAAKREGESNAAINAQRRGRGMVLLYHRGRIHCTRRVSSSAMIKPRTLVLRTAGSNCDRETVHAFNLAGSKAELLHVNRVLENPRVME